MHTLKETRRTSWSLGFSYKSTNLEELVLQTISKRDHACEIWMINGSSLHCRSNSHCKLKNRQTCPFITLLLKRYVLSWKDKVCYFMIHFTFYDKRCTIFIFYEFLRPTFLNTRRKYKYTLIKIHYGRNVSYCHIFNHTVPFPWPLRGKFIKKVSSLKDPCH